MASAGYEMIDSMEKALESLLSHCTSGLMTGRCVKFTFSNRFQQIRVRLIVISFKVLLYVQVRLKKLI